MPRARDQDTKGNGEGGRLFHLTLSPSARMGGAATASLVFHVLLGVLMLRIGIAVHPKVPEFVELNLGWVASAAPQEMAGSLARRPSELPPPSGTVRGTPRQVAVPKRRMIEIEEPLISPSGEERAVQKLLTPDGDEKRMSLPDRERTVLRRQEPLAAMGEKEQFDRKMDIGIVPGSGVETAQVGSDVEAGFTIEGEVKNRIILNKVLPDPTEVHREAVIRLSLTVRPNGVVGETRPVRKGDTHLENLAILAIRQWRFQPLSPDQEQVIQTGEITFTYTLK
ncbi:MAG: energy transducer TonB [Candidatus Latescibacterota bacterium]